MFGPTSQPSSAMRNPFVVLRFALFAVLIYVNILAFGFAIYNLTILNTLGIHDLGPPTLVIFNACFLVGVLIGCLVTPRFTGRVFDQVRCESAWTGVLSVLQLASSFNVTANGPPVLCQGISVSACASSSLMVALSWISSMTVLLYVFSLVTTTITHMNILPDVWTSSVRAVPWFVEPAICLESRRMRSEPSPESTPIDIKRLSFHYPTPIFEKHTKALPSSPLEPPTFPATPASPTWSSRRGSAASLRSTRLPPTPVERRTTWTSRAFGGASALSHKFSAESLRPGWAKRLSARRGLDQPFALPRFPFRPPPPPPVRPLRPLKLKSCWSQSTASPPPVSMPMPVSMPVPALPPRARVAGLLDQALSPASTFYIDVERDAVVPVGSAARPASYGMFPEDVVDPDQPITRSQRGVWVRAGSETSSVQ